MFLYLVARIIYKISSIILGLSKFIEFENVNHIFWSGFYLILCKDGINP